MLLKGPSVVAVDERCYKQQEYRFSAGKEEISVLVKWGYCGIQDAPYTQLAIKLFRSFSSASPLEQTILFAFLLLLSKVNRLGIL